jgi:hypothetical protein
MEWVIKKFVCSEKDCGIELAIKFPFERINDLGCPLCAEPMQEVSEFDDIELLSIVDECWTENEYGEFEEDENS